MIKSQQKAQQNRVPISRDTLNAARIVAVGSVHPDLHHGQRPAHRCAYMSIIELVRSDRCYIGVAEDQDINYSCTYLF